MFAFECSELSPLKNNTEIQDVQKLLVQLRFTIASSLYIFTTTSLYILKTKLTKFFNMVSKFLYGFHELARTILRQ